MQNKSPKVDARTLAPAKYPADPDMEWCAQLTPQKSAARICC